MSNRKIVITDCVNCPNYRCASGSDKGPVYIPICKWIPKEKPLSGKYDPKPLPYTNYRPGIDISALPDDGVPDWCPLDVDGSE